MKQKLHEQLPTSITVSGKRYHVDFSFRKILRAFEILSDNTILMESRVNAVLRLLVGRRCKDRPDILQAIFEHLGDGESKSKQEQSFDFVQDAGLIYAAFRQAYGINLFTDELSWWEFLQLFSCLPEDTRMAQVMSIRTRPIPKPTKYNQEERANIIRLKQRYALQKTQAEREANIQTGLAKLAETLLQMAKE